MALERAVPTMPSSEIIGSIWYDEDAREYVKVTNSVPFSPTGNWPLGSDTSIPYEVIALRPRFNKKGDLRWGILMRLAVGNMKPVEADKAERWKALFLRAQDECTEDINARRF